MSPADVIKRYNILDRFCGDKMMYRPIKDFQWDADLLTNDEKFIGIAKIFFNPSNFGTQPIVEIPAEETDFMWELGLLTHKKPAIIVKFRNKIAYLRLDHLNYRLTEGKRKQVYVIPIGEFKVL
jgi:hypothetical protein